MTKRYLPYLEGAALGICQLINAPKAHTQYADKNLLHPDQ
jgi:hypothetical protein